MASSYGSANALSGLGCGRTEPTETFAARTASASPPRAERSTTMAMRRLAAAIGSLGTSGSRSALPVTLRTRDRCRPALDQQPPRGIGAIGRKFPIGAARTGEWCRVSVTGDRDVLRQSRQHWRHLLQQQPGPVVGHRRAEREHRFAISIADLNAQPFRRYVDRELACELRQLRIVLTASRICCAACSKACFSRLSSSARNSASVGCAASSTPSGAARHWPWPERRCAPVAAVASRGLPPDPASVLATSSRCGRVAR